MKIIHNRIQCKHCGDTLESFTVHDFKECSCKTVCVDGGKQYLRRCFKNSPDDFTELSEYYEEDMKD